MSLPLLLGLAGLSGVWVYFDATRHRIGKIDAQAGFLNMSAGAWAIATIGLWLLAFPFYLMARSGLIARARTMPVDVSHRAAKLVLLGLLGLLTASSVLSARPARLAPPPCDLPAVATTIAKLIDAAPESQRQGQSFVSLVDTRELSGTDSERRCRGTLVTTKQRFGVRFSTTWEDAAHGRFLVEKMVRE